MRKIFISAIRRWAKAALGLTDEQIIPVVRGDNQKVMRLPLPYLTVNLTNFDMENGVDWKGFTTTGTEHRGNRFATVRLTGYGEETEGWLTELGMRTGEYEEDFGSLINYGNGVMDASQQHADHIEAQYVRDFRLDYRLSLALTGVDDPNEYADTLIVNIEEDDELLTTIEV